MKFLFLFLILLLCSCEHSEPEGYCSSNPLKLSKRELFFNADGGIDSVTQKYGRLLPYIEIGDTIVNYSFLSPAKYCLKKDTCSFLHDYEGNISYLFMEKQAGDGKKYLDYSDVRYLETSWFTISRPDNEKIIFSVNKNETENARDFDIFLDAGNCSFNIKINQSPE